MNREPTLAFQVVVGGVTFGLLLVVARQLLGDAWNFFTAVPVGLAIGFVMQFGLPWLWRLWTKVNAQR